MSKLRCFVKVTCHTRIESDKNKSHHLTCHTSSMCLYTSRSQHQVKATPRFLGHWHTRGNRAELCIIPNTVNSLSGAGSYIEVAKSPKRRIQDLSPPILKGRMWKMLFHFQRLNCKEAAIKVSVSISIASIKILPRLQIVNTPYKFSRFYKVHVPRKMPILYRQDALPNSLGWCTGLNTQLTGFV